MRCPAAIPAVTLAVGVAAGVLLSEVVPSPQPYLSLALLAAAAALLVGRREGPALACLAAGFICAGFTLGSVADSSTRRTPLREVFDRHLAHGEHQLFALVEGRLRRDAALGASGVTLDLIADRVFVDGAAYTASGGALVSVGGLPSARHIDEWRAGRGVGLPVSLRLPTQYRNPGLADSARSMERRGFSLVGSVKSAHLVEITSVGNWRAETTSALRVAIRHAIQATVTPWSNRSAAVVAAIVIGDRAGLDEKVERRLQEAGTYHVVAISGGNIAIFAGVCLALLRAIRVRTGTASFFTIGLLTAYAAIVEGGSSVARATLMAAIVLVTQAWDHRSDALNIAALSAAMLIAANPLQLVDAGFWLTFGATLAILAGTAELVGRLSPPQRLRGPVAIIAATVCAEVVLFPICAYVFSRITAAGLVVNLVAIPLMTIVQIAGLAAVAMAQAAPETARFAGWIAHAAVEGLIASAAIVDWAPWLTRRIPPPEVPLLCAYYGSLVLAVMLRGHRQLFVLRRAATTATIVCGVWIATAPIVALSGSPAPLRVIFLDVGQGDAAIVQFPNGRTLSVDAGGLASTSFDIAGRVISPALWALGIRRLDYMTITHGDVDHAGGAANLFNDFPPLEVWEGVPVPPHRTTQELRRLASQAGAAWRTVQPRERIMFDAVELVVHHPPHPEWERQRVRNDDSQVIELRYHDVSIVFTGDIGREVEAHLTTSFAPAAVRILKAPHHGSAGSSSQPFIDALRPDIVAISAGRGNPFGHPAPQVVQRYREAGAAIYRTDEDGAVTLETDGRTVKVRTFTGRTLTLTTTTRKR